MQNQYSILLVDNDEAFATMLRESLEESGEYRVTVETDGHKALQALTTTQFDLAVVDLGLTDPEGTMVARTLRQQQADLRLILIPLFREEIPPDLADLDIQGVLPKPFFLPELPGRIADALARSVGEGPSTAEEAVPDVISKPTVAAHARVPEERLPKIVQAMTGLADEINADAVILTCEGELIAHTGVLSGDEFRRLAQAVGESWQTSARVAQILGQEQLRFEQSVESGDHMLYSLALAEAIVLSVALRANAPLGMIRHRTKRTAEVMRSLIVTPE